MLLRLLLLLACAVCVRADWTPFQADLGPRLRLSDAERDVIGLRVGLLPESHELYGVSVGLLDDRTEAGGGGLSLSPWRSTLGGHFVGVHAGLLQNRGEAVTGLEIGLLNETREVYGLSAGLWSGREDTEIGGLQFGAYARANRLYGFQIAGITIAGRSLHGLQASLIGGLVEEELYGIQIAPYARTRDLRGISMGLASHCNSAQGLQLGLASIASTRVEGLQFGALNWSGDVRGVQLGLFNIADHLQGVQIGLINIVHDNAAPRVMPLLNARF